MVSTYISFVIESTGPTSEFTEWLKCHIEERKFTVPEDMWTYYTLNENVGEDWKDVAKLVSTPEKFQSMFPMGVQRTFLSIILSQPERGFEVLKFVFEALQTYLGKSLRTLNASQTSRLTYRSD